MEKNIITIVAEEGKEYKLTLKEPDFPAYAKALNILNTTDEGSMKIIEAGDAIILSTIISEESDMVVLTRPDLRVMAAQAAISLLRIWNTDLKKS